MSKKMSDRICGTATIIIAAIFFWEGRSLSLVSNIFPLCLEGFLVITGLYLLIRSLRLQSEQNSDEELAYRRIWIMLGATIAYIVAINVIGFYLATGIFLTVMSWLFNEHGFNARTLAYSVVFGMVVTSALYVTFWLFLQVPTPNGMLFD